MKMALVTVSLVILAAVTSTSAQLYPTTWDNIDVDKILSNDRLVSAYANCLLDKGPCTSDAATLKKVLPEALRTGCAKCTQLQKDKGAKVIRYIMNKRPELWQQIRSKFDPDGSYTKKFSGQR